MVLKVKIVIFDEILRVNIHENRHFTWDIVVLEEY